MPNIDELAVTMQEVGEGPWELTLDDGETIAAELDDIEVTEQHGFHAEGVDQREDDEDRLVELSTGIQPGGAIHLKRRPISAEEWHVAGEVVAADKCDHV